MTMREWIESDFVHRKVLIENIQITKSGIKNAVERRILWEKQREHYKIMQNHLKDYESLGYDPAELLEFLLPITK